MLLWDACIEEIALEGLDGVTLPTLWLRLQARPDIEYQLDDLGKQWIWSFLRKRNDILTFHQLPESRVPLSFGDDEVLVEHKDMYPVNVIVDGDQWGSCSSFYNRVNVTDQICSGGDYETLNDALNVFSAERLVIVASQKERNRALFGDSCEYETLFRENVVSRQYYAMLERIGRSRYSGVNAGANDSLHLLFNMRAKDVFYVIKRLDSWGVIKKQVASTMVNQTKLMTATVATLTRYGTPLDRSKYLAPMRKLVLFLEQKPDKRATLAEVKEFFGISTACYVKKMIHTFPNVVQSILKKVDVPVTTSSPQRRRKAKKQRLVEEVEDTSDVHHGAEVAHNGNEEPIVVDGQGGAVTIHKAIVRYYELIGKLHLDEETGELTVKAMQPDASEASAVAGGDEEDDEAFGSSSVDWSKYNPFRTRVFETLRVIRQAGAHGVDNHALRKEIGIGRKQVERLVNNLKRGNQFKSVVENDGKRRQTKLVWMNAEHQAEQHHKRFEELTNLAMTQFGDKERLMLGEQSIKRMIFIMERSERVPVAPIAEYLRYIRDWEQDQGYGHLLDKKCLSSLCKFLSNYGQLNTFVTILKEGSLQRTVEFVCHKSITLASPELQSKLCAARMDLARSSRREGQSELLLESHGAGAVGRTSQLRKEKRSGRELNSDPQEVGEPLLKKPRVKDPAKRIKERPDLPLFMSMSLSFCRPPRGSTDAPWRRSHPAVQKQLQQCHIGATTATVTNTVSTERKTTKGLDAADVASVHRKKKLRAQFTQKERQMLLLIRAVSYVFYPGSRLWVEAGVVRDLMHKYLPESKDKTSKTLVQTSARELGTNPRSGESMLAMAEQLQKADEIKRVKKRLSTMANGITEKRWAFEKAFEIARRMFFGDADAIDYDDIDLNFLYESYDVSLEKPSKTLWPIEDVESETDILENTAKRVIYSALSLSRRDGTFAPQLNMIYKTLPDTVLLRVFSRLRRNGMLVLRSRGSTTGQVRQPQEPLPKRRSSDLSLSFFYRHFFYHHYHVALAKEAKTLLDAMVSQRDEWHGVLTGLPGNLATLISLAANKQIYFDLTVPSNVVVYGETDANRTHASEADDDDDWPQVISATTTNLLQNEDDYVCDMATDTTPSSSGPSATQFPLAMVKTEPEQEAVHLACHSANKSLLYKLRQERLQACETTDSRTIKFRVRDLTLNSCTLLAKLSSTFKENNTSHQRKAKEAISKLTGGLKIDTNVDAGDDEQDSGELQETICEILRRTGAFGLTENELQEEVGQGDFVRLCLENLIARRLIYVCGIAKRRFVHASFIDPWTIDSVRVAKEDRGQVLEDPTAETIRGEPVKFMPRPWLKPDGTLNKPMLRWLCEGLFLRLLGMPGVTATHIQEQFAPVMDPVETDELIQFLISIDCMTRSEQEFETRNPQLFGPPIVEKVKVVWYDVPLDALIKFAAVFEKSPMPDFVTHLLAGRADRGAAVFGRRRFHPKPSIVPRDS